MVPPVKPLLPLILLLVTGCVPGPDLTIDLSDDPVSYIDSPAYRRGILERDLTTVENSYAGERLAQYGLGDRGWDQLPTADFPSRPLTDEDRAALSADAPLPVGGRLYSLVPEEFPNTDAEWIALGRRVFFEYPLRADGNYRTLAGLDEGLERTGWLRDEDDGWVGLRVFADEEGELQVGNTCAQCHASYDGRAEPVLDGVLSNRAMDIGAIRLRVLGFEPENLPDETDSTAIRDLERLGPGRADVLSDLVFNPYAFPDFGGLGDVPYLHHNANWRNEGVATLAVRCETLFITSSGRRTRIPRVLAWALAMWQRSLPPPEPLNPESSALFNAGQQVFEEVGCDLCHAPPLYTSDREVRVTDIGTDPAAGESPVRWSGHYRIPSLRGVGRTAPYLHDGSVPTLDLFFEPKSDIGHPYGKELDEADTEALIAFLRGI